ncbi:MAG: aldose epimerase family protein, partial [Bryobacteraceae bacterium]
HKHFADVVLGFDNLHGYLGKNDPFFGATIGRYANRIANGTFTLDGNTYHIPINDGPNALHGGPLGFDKRIWQGKTLKTPDGFAAELTYFSPNGQEGFPGNLHVTVRYTLEKSDALRIDYTATTDQDTVINLTNHSYFNLSGAGSPTILKEKVMIDADHYTPINSTLIPTGQIAPVAGTPLDFRQPTAVGARIHDNNQQLKYAGGYDFNYVLNHPGDLSAVAAKVEAPASGRVLEAFTTQPGLQFYSGNQITTPIHGVGGVYRRYSALTLETQHYPDSPNHPNFPSTVLHPGQPFHSTTIFRFSTE